MLARTNLLENYFSRLFEEIKPVDVEPNQVVPTWRNSRRGNASISQRLDRFLVAERIVEESTR